MTARGSVRPYEILRRRMRPTRRTHSNAPQDDTGLVFRKGGATALELRAMGDASAVLVIGDINVDAMARLRGPLALGTDNLHAGFELQLGGVGANVAVSLAKCGASVRLAGCAGRDWLGDFAMAALARQHVNTEFVARVDGVSGLVVIPVDPDGRRTILGARGANDWLPAGTVEQWLDGARAAHMVGYTLLSERTAALPLAVAREAKSRGVRVSFDPGPGPCELARERVLAMLPQTDMLFIGLDEAESLTQKKGAEALAAIAACGAAEVILKRGEGGSQFFEAGRWWAMPPFPVSAVDTTGAGDAFAAAYLWARLRGRGMADAALLANAMGAAASLKVGAGEAMPGLDDARALAGKTSGDTKLSGRLLRLLQA